MKIVFFGTPKFAANILSYLFEKKVNIVALVTQPDIKKNGRENFSETKKVSSLYLDKTDIYQPEKASNPEFINEIKKYDADLFIVVAYGQILKQALLDVPKQGCINVHASLLPKFRGAAPIHHAILNGEKKTGVTIQKMARKLDTGPIILQKEIELKEDMIFTELEEELCLMSKPLLLEVIEMYKKNDVHLQNQDESKASYANKITKEMKEIHFEDDAKKIYDQIRAFAKKPAAFCKVKIHDNQKELKIFETKIVDKKIKPKEILVEDSSVFIGCKDKSLELIEVQLEGKKKMRASDFMRGAQGKISFL
ncbi:MAG: Methionyl-tRNA formyltransferase [Candidatus Anoxychlamydiales bacterium]|nr:Methionyl-tRNA formyltransferase [Candidatus Anoxychlamydiales bacterium]